MTTTLESNGTRAAKGGQQGTLAPRPGGGYMLPWSIRAACFCVGVFVAYAQFVSVAMTFLYRYYDRYDYHYGAEPEGFLGGNFLVLALWLPGGSIGINEDYPVWLTMLAAVVIVMFGSAGLFTAAYARSHWRLIRIRLLLSFICGIVAAFAALHIQMFDGAIRLKWLNLFNIDNSYAFFPMHGLLEFVGSTLLPCLAYSVLALWLLIHAVAKWIGDDTRRDASGNGELPPGGTGRT